MSDPAGPRGTVSELGEFGLIDRLARRLGPTRPDVLVGIGDDVAAIAIDPHRLLLVTCDCLVAGTHFVPGRSDPRRLGRKAAAINLSDIAAAGGSPTHFVVSLVLPADTEVAFVEALYDGLASEASGWDTDVVGGNVSRGEVVTIDVTLLGEARRDALLRRDGARPGDLVVVTGSLGAAAAGLHLTLHPALDAGDTWSRQARDAFEAPTPRLDEARALVELGGASAAIDISDGLLADLAHVCERSGVGASVSCAAVPVHAAASAIARSIGANPLDWALGGGEDYELLFTAAPARAAELARAVARRTGTAATIVGEITEDPERRALVRPDGSRDSFGSGGWRHF